MEKKKATFLIDAGVMKKMKFLAVEQDKNLTELFLEAIHLLFKKYEKKAKK
jgi:hypothetical protein